MSRLRPTFLLLALALGPALGCRSRGREVVVYLSIDQVFTEPILRDFERQEGVKVRAVFDTEETKSTGVLNRIVAEAGSPQADVFWSGDPVRPLLLAKRGLVRPYASPSAAGVPPAFKAADGSWTGGAARARLLLVNRDRVKPDARPRSVRDLADPRWKGQTALANPLFGTTTMHVAALADVWGDEALKAFLGQLRANGCRIASSNGEVKRLVASGEVAFGLADTDDAAEALREGAPVDVVYPDQDGMGTLLMPTAVAMLAGPHPEPARRLVDFLLSTAAEQKLVDLAAHLPLRAGVSPAPGGRRAEDVRAMRVDYARLADTMERLQPWLREWAGL
ncbi:extracellular solute-binding protein [Anaeromyxobacter diazotrophicus]|uniref:Iron transporter n=1 Tax=Anaeromyxobacter diazotrophicus TaxID=2590199 RepID=A0A7I9VL33_9BACT|nr:extracellular solute-binding protein [Anaeromyxobacter diazotrophicus]GEJ57124.1 iron transporter [Anaeromyxobacter diazotrophicus]